MNSAIIFLLCFFSLKSVLISPSPKKNLGDTSHTIAFQEDYSRRVQSWLNAGIQACTRRQYAEALQQFQRILDVQPPVKPVMRGYIYSWIANVHCYRQDSSAAFQALHLAADTGYAEWEESERLLKTFHYTDSPEAKSIIAAMKHNAAVLKVYDVHTWQNPSIAGGSLLRFADYHSPSSQKLRSEYHLASLIEGKKSELEQQCALMSWTHNLWEHSASGFANDCRATEILASVKKGKAFRCQEYSIVLSEALQAVGFPARIVELGREGISFGIGKSHFVVEVWNNGLQKWILLDPQNNLLWHSSSSAIPLNALEIRLLLSSPRDSTSLRLQASLVQSRWRSIQAFRSEEWIPYFHHLFYQTDSRSNRISPEFLPMTNLLAQLQTPELAYQGGIRPIHFTQRNGQMYTVQNRVQIDVQQASSRTIKERFQEPSNVLILNLQNSMPWFTKYLIEANAHTTQQSTNVYAWHLVKGKNTLVVTGVNSAGIVGIPTRIELTYYGQPMK